jgi:hypothetical protein
VVSGQWSGFGFGFGFDIFSGGDQPIKNSTHFCGQTQ